MSSAEWSSEELNETLYKIDENTNKEVIVIDEIKQEANSKNEESNETMFLALDIQQDEVHIVEFYAPWCPHCQHFKSQYINLAKEMQRRTIATRIQFHAVSCTLNEVICDTYEIAGFPTVMGWRGGEDYADFNDIQKPGLILNEEGTVDADSIAEDLDIPLAEEELLQNQTESKFSNSQDQRDWEKRKMQWGLESAKEHLAMMEYDSDINERYHNAAVSLAYLLKTSIYESSKETLNDKKAHVLYDFLTLVDWATPFEWDFRKQFVQVLLNKFDSDVIRGKRMLVDLVEGIQAMPFKTGRRREELLWGHLNEHRSRKKYNRRTAIKNGLGGESESHVLHVPLQTILKEHSKWTDACSHGTSFKGFTCGLWDLFHILTIGSIQYANRVHGIRKGYIVSSRHVAVTLRNFIEYFFRCDVCRTNFLKMYDSCTHDHCTRLSDVQIPIKEAGQEELVLWLWEVHNAVNLRLMKEAAEREQREISREEIISSKFPSRRMCHKCWLDVDQNHWNSSEIYKFLSTWYWPTDQDPYLTPTMALNIHSTGTNGNPLSWSGFYLALIPFLYIVYLFAKDYLSRVTLSWKWKQNKSQ